MVVLEKRYDELPGRYDELSLLVLSTGGHILVGGPP
jgi:hypothetical protein